MKDIFETVAEQNGVSADEVEKEIEKAIDLALNSANPQQAELWKEISENEEMPTPETVVDRIAQTFIEVLLSMKDEKDDAKTMFKNNCRRVAN